jgi:hypothetical protein
MRISMLALGLLACTGDDGGGDYSYFSTVDNTADDDGGPPPPGGTGEIDCDQIPNLEPDDSDDCDELATGLASIIEAATECFEKSDCRALSIPCENWDAAPGCFAIVNTCLSEQDIDKWHPDEVGVNGCDTVVPGFPDTDCQCGAPPNIDCISGVCQEVFTNP